MQVSVTHLPYITFSVSEIRSLHHFVQRKKNHIPDVTKRCVITLATFSRTLGIGSEPRANSFGINLSANTGGGNTFSSNTL